MMDADDEARRVKWMLAIGLLFLVSAFFSWREFKYALAGTKTNAEIVRVYETREIARRGRTREKLAIEYQFTDANGVKRKESDTISIDSPPPRGKTVAVQYLGSPGSSRLVGNGNSIWVIIFFGALAFFGFKFFQLVRESRK
ncbi:MAG: hypothetical protein QOE14_2011 [Humisphaera sp.]|nr:hypothetical protein [Humisphaera sp.]